MTPLAKDKKEQYYLIAKSWDKVDYEDLIEQMVHNTSLTREEAKTAMSYLLEAIPELLKLGCTINLGKLGYFRVTIQSAGSDTPEEASHHKIRHIRIHFVPGKQLRKTVRNLPVERFPEKGETTYQSSTKIEKSKIRQEAMREQQIETVRKSFAENLSVQTIAQITGLSEVEVVGIRNS